MQPLTLPHAGAEHFAGCAIDLLPELYELAESLPVIRAGYRLHQHPGLDLLLEPARPIMALARSLGGIHNRPVRAILFDKSENANWAVAWHQDRTICVRQKVECEGFGPWTVKQGLHHVAPPQAVLEQMITVRVHLDDVPADNAPLLIAPGSHRLGKVAEKDIAGAVAQCGEYACLASAGDIWAYATPVLHASQAVMQPRRRRVLQIDFCGLELPGELEWLGV